MEIVPLKAFRDNYIWLLRSGPKAAVVDPGDAAPVLAYLAAQDLQLAAVLLTHHHGDHVGGVPELAARTGAGVYGPADDGIAGIDVPLSEPQTLRLPDLKLEFAVLDVPGHTRGHIAYYGHGRLFCGDTLFGCGCGRLFEGTAQQMWQSLSKLAALPANTGVYCAHEYTQANMDFAFAVEPGNPALARREEAVAALRAAQQPSVPSTLAEELETNPFLRPHVPEVAAAASRFRGFQVKEAVEVFAALREWKNGF